MKLLFSVFMCAGFFMASGNIQAQGKTGHINMQELVMVMPEYAKARAKIDSMEKEMSGVLRATQAEFQSKYAEYQEKQSTWSEYMRGSKEKELQDLDNRLRGLQEQAQSVLSQENDRLMSPIVKKAKEIVGQVAKEAGYGNVIDNSSNVLVVSNPADDLLPIVMKKLGIPSAELQKMRDKLEKEAAENANPAPAPAPR